MKFRLYPVFFCVKLVWPFLQAFRQCAATDPAIQKTLKLEGP